MRDCSAGPTTAKPASPLSGDDEFCLLDNRLNVLWSADTPTTILTAPSTRGDHNIAAGTRQQRQRPVERRPQLRQFDAAAAEVSAVQRWQASTVRRLPSTACCTAIFTGKEVFARKTVVNGGRLSVTEDGKRDLLGESRAWRAADSTATAPTRPRTSSRAPPTASRPASSANASSPSTIERHLYWLDADGNPCCGRRNTGTSRQPDLRPLRRMADHRLQSGRVSASTGNPTGSCPTLSSAACERRMTA